MMKSPVAQYAVITANYWAFTLTDGALRMLVILYFHQLGFSPLNIALLFVLYELFGVITNLWGGWLGARIGLNITMQVGLALQIIALAMLLVDTSLLTAFYVMVSQALSGVAKDLNKMSAKSTIKTLISNNQQLYRWVALLTGSKNALKGVGFFLGGVLLAWIGFKGTIISMVVMLTVTLLASLCLLRKRIGSSQYKAKFTDVFSSNANINYLSATRFFLFGSRDIWFAVALPVFLQNQLGWNHTAVGTTLALWIIAYGGIQAITPKLTRAIPPAQAKDRLQTWGLLLLAITFTTAAALFTSFHIGITLLVGLFIFGGIFAVNSSIHSYLIVAHAREDGASMDVGFYYMANAAGRLSGILLSGLLYQYYGFTACLLASCAFIVATLVINRRITGVTSY